MNSKMLLFFAIVIFSTITLSAQIQKKDWLLGGTFGYNTSNSGSPSNYSNSNLTPHISYAVGKNAVMGLSTNVAFSKNSSEENYSSFGFGAYYKKFFPLKNKFGAYFQLNGGTTWTWSSFTIFDSAGILNKNKTTTTNYGVGAVPGIYYEVTPGILINADCGGIFYGYSRGQDGYWNSNFAVNFLNSFTFGVDFILGRKKS